MSEAKFLGSGLSPHPFQRRVTLPHPTTSTDPARNWHIAHTPTPSQNAQWAHTLHTQPASLFHSRLRNLTLPLHSQPITLGTQVTQPLTHSCHPLSLSYEWLTQPGHSLHPQLTHTSQAQQPAVKHPHQLTRGSWSSSATSSRWEGSCWEGGSVTLSFST